MNYVYNITGCLMVSAFAAVFNKRGTETPARVISNPNDAIPNVPSPIRESEGEREMGRKDMAAPPYVRSSDFSREIPSGR